MTKPKTKKEAIWFTELRSLARSKHKPSIKRWIKQNLNKSRRKEEIPTDD